MQLTEIGKIVDKVVNKQQLSASEQLILKNNKGVSTALKVLLNDLSQVAQASQYFHELPMQYLAAATSENKLVFDYIEPEQTSPTFSVIFENRSGQWFANWYFKENDFYFDLCDKEGLFKNRQGVLVIYNDQTGQVLTEVSPNMESISYEVVCLSALGELDTLVNLKCGMK